MVSTWNVKWQRRCQDPRKNFRVGRWLWLNCLDPQVTLPEAPNYRNQFRKQIMESDLGYILPPFLKRRIVSINSLIKCHICPIYKYPRHLSPTYMQNIHSIYIPLIQNYIDLHLHNVCTSHQSVELPSITGCNFGYFLVIGTEYRGKFPDNIF